MLRNEPKHRNFSGADEDWISESIKGVSLRHVNLMTGSNGWASPPGDLFYIRSKNYFTKFKKSPAGDYLLSPAGMDWLKSNAKLPRLYVRPSRRKIFKELHFRCESSIPGKDQYSAVFYFAAEDPIPPGSLLHRFIDGDDSFRNQRLKIVNRIVKGPWIVKKTVGNYSACLLGKALTCNYHKGSNYLEIDVDIGSSTLATAILHLTLRYLTCVCVTIDMGFVVEAMTKDELPEWLIGAIRVCQIETSATRVLEASMS